MFILRLLGYIEVLSVVTLHTGAWWCLQIHACTLTHAATCLQSAYTLSARSTTKSMWSCHSMSLWTEEGALQKTA